MVENIVERVAKAICNAPWHVGTGHEICVDMARAAILETLQAMREPTKEMYKAAFSERIVRAGVKAIAEDAENAAVKLYRARN